MDPTGCTTVEEVVQTYNHALKDVKNGVAYLAVLLTSSRHREKLRQQIVIAT